MLDVLIVGDGPAGLALGGACARSLDTLVLGTGHPWTATYGTWVDDVADLNGITSTFAATTPVDVITADEVRRLEREYAIFDNDLLHARLDVARCEAAEVVGVEHDDASSTILGADGRTWTARLVVDATGSRPVLAEAPGEPRGLTVVQSAFGIVVDARPELGASGHAGILMDWRQPSDDRGSARCDATFLYAVPLGGGRWLIEETSLARREAMPFDRLRERLSRRLGRHLGHLAPGAEERVLIPMSTGVPRRSQRTAAFGAAAGYIHPASGYSVATSLRAAPRVAAAIADALEAGGDGAATSLAVWNAVWPAEHRRARALHDYGLAAMLRMTPEEIGMFFGAFFALPVERQRAYLRVDTTAAEVGATMRAVFSLVPWALRRRLAWGKPTPFVRLLR